RKQAPGRVAFWHAPGLAGGACVRWGPAQRTRMRALASDNAIEGSHIKRRTFMSRDLVPPHGGRRFAQGAAVASLALVMTAATARAAFTIFEAAGPNAASITPTRDAFRAAVGGGTVAGANGSFGGIRREINWDGVPETLSDPNPLPANFFNVNSPRGVVFSTP